MAKRYGLYDTQDGLWLGGDLQCPKTFSAGDPMPGGGQIPSDADAFMLARVAAEMAVVQLGWYAHRVVPMELPDDTFTIRDEVKTKMSPLRALTKMERGTYLPPTKMEFFYKDETWQEGRNRYKDGNWRKDAKEGTKGTGSPRTKRGPQP